MICPHCNAIVNDTQAFCDYCGSPLTPSKSAQTFPNQYPNQPSGPTQQPVSNVPFGLAIAGLICAAIGMFPVGIVLAIIALVMNSNQKKAGLVSTKQGPTKVMGIIGVVVSAVWLLMIILYGAAIIAAVEDGTFDNRSTTTPPSSVSTTTNSNGSVNTSPSSDNATTTSGSSAAAAGSSQYDPVALGSMILGDWELESGNEEGLDAESLDMMRETGVNVTLAIDVDSVGDHGTFDLVFITGNHHLGTWRAVDVIEGTGTQTIRYVFSIEGESFAGEYDVATERLTLKDSTTELVFRPME